MYAPTLLSLPSADPVRTNGADEGAATGASLPDALAAAAEPPSVPHCPKPPRLLVRDAPPLASCVALDE